MLEDLLDAERRQTARGRYLAVIVIACCLFILGIVIVATQSGNARRQEEKRQQNITESERLLHLATEQTYRHQFKAAHESVREAKILNPAIDDESFHNTIMDAEAALGR